jgi:hypothetical protein
VTKRTRWRCARPAARRPSTIVASAASIGLELYRREL